MRWSGYLSTQIPNMDALGRREWIPSALIAHTIGGICAGVVAHYFFLLKGQEVNAVKLWKSCMRKCKKADFADLSIGAQEAKESLSLPVVYFVSFAAMGLCPYDTIKRTRVYCFAKN